MDEQGNNAFAVGICLHGPNVLLGSTSVRFVGCPIPNPWGQLDHLPEHGLSTIFVKMREVPEEPCLFSKEDQD